MPNKAGWQRSQYTDTFSPAIALSSAHRVGYCNLQCSGLSVFQSASLVRSPYQFPFWASFPPRSRANATVFYRRRLYSIVQYKQEVQYFARSHTEVARMTIHMHRGLTIAPEHRCFVTFTSSRASASSGSQHVSDVIEGSNYRQKRGMSGQALTRTMQRAWPWLWRRSPKGTVTALFCCAAPPPCSHYY